MSRLSRSVGLDEDYRASFYKGCATGSHKPAISTKLVFVTLIKSRVWCPHRCLKSTQQLCFKKHRLASLEQHCLNYVRVYYLLYTIWTDRFIYAQSTFDIVLILHPSTNVKSTFEGFLLPIRNVIVMNEEEY